MARILTIMGSGETAPTMAKVHRRAIALGGGGPAVLLDTPYGFQENADDISARAQEYFARSVGTPIEVASMRTSADLSGVGAAAALERIRAGAYVFAGPGSPSYALRQWAGTIVPGLLAAKLASGGAVTFASAAALTLGVATIPVYEIYKAGEEPRWLEGLDLLGPATGLRAAVIPHYDNAEGGHHDTRFCYLGERRLVRLEPELPAGSVVLGVDEHTAALFDLDAGTMEVLGNATVTLRVAGQSTVWASGAVVGVEELLDRAAGRSTAVLPTGPVASAASDAALGAPAPAEAPSLLAVAEAAEARFAAAVAERDLDAASGAVLDLEQALEDWAADSLTGTDREHSRAILRGMVLRLAELARVGVADPRDAVAPYVELLLQRRSAARAAKDFAASDAIRDGLADAGVEVRDTPEGQVWLLR